MTSRAALPRLFLLWTFLLLGTGLARANTRLAIAEGVSLVLPPGFQHELVRADERVTVFEVRDGSDTLVVVVYRAVKKTVPGAPASLSVHVEELVHALGGQTRVNHEPLGLVLLGERRSTAHLHTLDPQGRVGWVVAADAVKGDDTRATIVCSALYLPGSPNAQAFVRIAASLTSR